MDHSRDILRGILHDNPEAVAVADQYHRIVEANPTLCALLNRTEADLLGASLASVLDTQGAAIAGAFRDALEDGRGTCRLPALAADHDYLTVLALRLGDDRNGPPASHFLFVYVRPRSDTDPASDEWGGDSSRGPRVHPDRFRELVDGVCEFGIYLLDPAGRVMTWNRGAERILQYREDEVVGHPIDRFYTPQDRTADRPRRALVWAAAHGTFNDEGWRVRRDGSWFRADVTITALRGPGGRITGFAKIQRDVTEHRAAERALQREQLAEERQRTMWQVLQVAVHEIRNPMTAALGAVRLIRDDPDDAASLLGVVEEEVTRLNRLLERFVYAVGTRDAWQPATPGTVVDTDLAALVQASVRMFEAVGSETVRLLGERSAVRVRVDPDAIRQVLDNVLTNARKYAAPGTPIEVRVERAGDVARVTVRDQGCGVPRDQLEAVFEPGVRLTAHAGTQPPQGSGLGLYVSRKILETHGGRIWMDSEVGVGSAVRIELPVGASDRPGP